MEQPDGKTYHLHISLIEIQRGKITVGCRALQRRSHTFWKRPACDLSWQFSPMYDNHSSRKLGSSLDPLCSRDERWPKQKRWLKSAAVSATLYLVVTIANWFRRQMQTINQKEGKVKNIRQRCALLGEEEWQINSISSSISEFEPSLHSYFLVH